MHRAVSMALVLILHILLIFALVRFMVSSQNSAFRGVPGSGLIELIVNTARPEARMTKKEPKLAPTPAAVQPAPQGSALVEPVLPTVPMLVPDIRGFGQALVGCAPENFTNFDNAQLSRCRRSGALTSYDPSAVDYADHAHEVPGAIRWERELARKNAPLLLPCGNAKGFDFVYTGGCIIANIANGFTFQKQYENQPAYFDGPDK